MVSGIVISVVLAIIGFVALRAGLRQREVDRMIHGLRQDRAALLKQCKSLPEEEQNKVVELLDIDSQGNLLDGKGAKLPEGAEPVFNKFDVGEVRTNSAGEPFETQPVIPVDDAEATKLLEAAQIARLDEIERGFQEAYSTEKAIPKSLLMEVLEAPTQEAEFEAAQSIKDFLTKPQPVTYVVMDNKIYDGSEWPSYRKFTFTFADEEEKAYIVDEVSKIPTSSSDEFAKAVLKLGAVENLPQASDELGGE